MPVARYFDPGKPRHRGEEPVSIASESGVREGLLRAAEDVGGEKGGLVARDWESGLLQRGTVDNKP